MTDILNEYEYDEIKIGLEHRFTEKITKLSINNFAKLSGDYNPLHVDEDYAKGTMFKKQICHGMLLASFFSKLVGMYIPGKNALYFSQTLNFQSPCYIDDTVTIRGKVIDKSDSTRVITIETSIHDQQGTCLVDGIAKVVIRQ